MAIKQYHSLHTDVTWYMDETGDPGTAVWISTVGSGAALDQSQALVTHAGNPTGQMVLGVLLNEMVDIDQTKQHINWHKDQVQKGGKVSVMTQGWVVTDKLHDAPTAGANAFVTNSGHFITTAGEGGNILVGRFLSGKDEDGYAKIEINLP